MGKKWPDRDVELMRRDNFLCINTGTCDECKSSGVYIVRLDGYYKIGCGLSAAARANQVTMGHPNTELVRVYLASKHYEREREIIRNVEEKRVKREWFDLCDDDIYSCDSLVRSWGGQNGE